MGTPQEITSWEGKVVWSGKYKAYGNLALKQVEDVENNIRFQGQYYDQETGLHYNRHRYYDPNIGQFISQDPIGLLGGGNNYRYGANPAGWIDPLGLSCKEGDGAFPKEYDPFEEFSVYQTVEKNTSPFFVQQTDLIYQEVPGVRDILEPHELLALRTYTGDNYANMNGLLRGRTPPVSPEWEPVNSAASRALEKLGEDTYFGYEGIVYRGTKMTEEKVHQRFPEVGEIYTDKGFSSSSTNKNVAHEGYFKGNVEITANTKSGVRVDEISAVPSEDEILFKPDTRFKITKKELKNDGVTWDIHLEELD